MKLTELVLQEASSVRSTLHASQQTSRYVRTKEHLSEAKRQRWGERRSKSYRPQAIGVRALEETPFYKAACELRHHSEDFAKNKTSLLADPQELVRCVGNDGDTVRVRARRSDRCGANRST